MFTKSFPWWAIHQETASTLLRSIWGVSLVIRLPDPFAVGSLIDNWSGNMTMPLGVHTIFFVRIFSRLRHETHVADVYLDSSKPCRQCRVLFGGSIYFLQCSLLWFRNRWSLQTSRSVFHVILLFITFWLQILSSDYHLMLGDKILLPMLITWLLQNPPPPHYHHLIITKPFSLWSSLGVYLLPMLITWLLQNPPHLMITNWCLVITKPSSPRSSLGVSLDHFARPHLQSKYLPPPFHLEIVVFLVSSDCLVFVGFSNSLPGAPLARSVDVRGLLPDRRVVFRLSRICMFVNVCQSYLGSPFLFQLMYAGFCQTEE